MTPCLGTYGTGRIYGPFWFYFSLLSLQFSFEFSIWYIVFWFVPLLFLVQWFVQVGGSFILDFNFYWLYFAGVGSAGGLGLSQLKKSN